MSHVEFKKCQMLIRGELAQKESTRPLIQRSLVRFRFHTGVMDYDESCFMHLTPGVVHNFPKGCGCKGFLSPMHKNISDS